MAVSKLFVLSSVWGNETQGELGPAAADGSRPGPAIVEAIALRLKATIEYADGLNLGYYNDGGDVGSEQLADAHHQTIEAPGRPMVLILTVGAPPDGFDGTLIEYNAGHRAEAETLADHLVTLAAPGSPWPVVVREDARLPTEGPATVLRVTLGSVIGDRGAESMLDPEWQSLVASQLRSGILVATLYVES